MRIKDQLGKLLSAYLSKHSEEETFKVTSKELVKLFKSYSAEPGTTLG